MAHVRDSDTALWLHNKLGSAEELWIPSSISAIIKTTTIDNIYRCFPVLTTTVKLKLLLGVLHLPRRNLEEMKHTIEGVIELALEDSDLWVKLIASIIKTYPMSFNLNLDLTASPIAQHVLQQAAEKVKSADTFSNLPLECQFVNKSALQSLVGVLPPLKRHFQLLKRPKSAALRTELLQKSDDAVSQLKKGGVGMGSKTVPVKHRDMTRRSSDIGPMKRIPTKALMSRPEVTRSISTAGTPIANRSLARTSNRQQAGGTKLLDISEQPIGGSGIGVRDSKRRKKMMQQQDAALASQQQEEEELESDKPPEYAAGLIPSMSTTVDSEHFDRDLSSPDKPQSATARRSTTESTEQESSSEEEDETEERKEEFEKAVSVSTTAPVRLPPTNPLPTSSPVSTINVRLLSPPTTAAPATTVNIKVLSSPINSTPNRNNQPISFASPTLIQSPRTQIVQPNTTIYRLTSPPRASNQTNPVSLRQIQVTPQRPPVIRQLTPSRSQQASTAPTMQTPVVVRKITTQSTPPSAAASNSRPIMQQQRIQNAASMYVSNRPVLNQPRQQLTLTQNTQQPRTIVIRQQEPQQQQQLQRQQAQQQHQIQQLHVQRQLQPASHASAINQQPRLIQQQVPVPNQNFYQARQMQMQQRLPVASQPQPQATFMKPQTNNPPTKHGLMLTREQMYEAQELFRLAPNLTRPEKAIILGFIAGNRENPYPDQGDIIRFILSESLQHIQNASGGIFPVIVELVLELNYSTGKLSKVSRLKPTAQAVLKT